MDNCEFWGKLPKSYDKDVVAALAASICILPPGSCVDLNSGEKALVIEENPEDFTRPLLLIFSDNELCDLRQQGAKPGIHVKDVMKTMANRIVMDEETLKQCKKNNMYTIIPNIIGDYTEIKNNISNGSIILINNTNNLNIIIKYINSKGYNIVLLSNLLKE